MGEGVTREEIIRDLLVPTEPIDLLLLFKGLTYCLLKVLGIFEVLLYSRGGLALWET